MAPTPHPPAHLVGGSAVSLMTQDAERRVTLLLAICVASFVKHLLRSFAALIGLFVSSLLLPKTSLCVPDIRSMSVYMCGYTDSLFFLSGLWVASFGVLTHVLKI